MSAQRTPFQIAFTSSFNLTMLAATIVAPMGWLMWLILRSYTGYLPEVFFGAAKGFLGRTPEYLWLWAAPVTFAAYLVLSFFSQLATSKDDDGVVHRAPLDAWIQVGSLFAGIGIAIVYVFWLYVGVHAEGNSLVAPLLPMAVCAAFYQIGRARTSAVTTSYAESVEREESVSKRTDYGSSTVAEGNLEVHATRASLSFKDIHGNREIKKRILVAAQTVLENTSSEKPRNGILLSGEPGNGKTVLAEALAGELKVNFVPVTYGDIVSQWMGETPKNLRALFKRAIECQPCVLFIDEIDSFITERSSINTNYSTPPGVGNGGLERRDIVNTMLTGLVDIRKHKVVVVAATNFIENLDAAAIREGRFDFKIEITPPDQEARVGLLTQGLRKNVPKLAVDPATIETVATRWNGFSVKRILAVTEEMPTYLDDCADKGQPVKTLQFEDFMAALRSVQGRKGVRPENVRPLSEMILPQDTLDAVDMIARRLRDPLRVERLGGTLPSGIIFYGPPGTGKTAVCKALAKDCDYAFVVKTGADLCRDPGAVERTYREAKELRPAIIFIDEADDLLRNREMSGATEATNKLLTLMDGIADKVKDVIWVAATNHIQNVDPALLRGGRFTEKVEFFRPDGNQLVVHIEKWLIQRKIGLGRSLSASGIGEMMGDESVANAEAVLQYAVNRAIGRAEGDTVTLESSDIEAACRVVLGALQ